MLRLILSCAFLAACAPQLPGQARGTCVVASVVDGDTFRCAGGDRVRLIGIDAPERGQGEIYVLARTALAGLVAPGDTVELEWDAARADRYGRPLAWVWRDSVLVNEALVSGGWAVLYTVPPNVRHVERLERAQRAARRARSGLWAGGGFSCAPSAHRRGDC
ncbi:MAG TPA: thermonuclease family protein [Gemmatimonadales bacterium]